jgi:hypothetical protein
MNVEYALEIGSYNFEKRTKGYCLHLQRPLKPGKGALHAGQLSNGHLWAGAGPPGSGPLSDVTLCATFRINFRLCTRGLGIPEWRALRLTRTAANVQY